jgi:MFS family permease
MRKKMTQTNQPPLWTKNYIFATLANLFNAFGFFGLLPILPIFLVEKYGITQSQIGIILASYAFSMMIARPISAYFSDLYNRKTILLIVLLVYTLLFLPYPFIGLVAVFWLLRVIHGFFYGGAAVCANALIIDIIDKKRRGEGLGIFGITNSIAMAAGPMFGLFLLDTTNNFFWIFLMTFISCLIAFFLIFAIRVPKEKKITSYKNPENKKLSIDKLYQPKGIFAGIVVILLAYPYGLITSFTAVYGKELGILSGSGIFFAFMSAGLVFARLISGKLVDKGKITAIIKISSLGAAISFTLFAAPGFIEITNPIIMRILFYFVGIALGLCYGMFFPAINMLFVNLSPDNRRAAANSTFLTSWDIGLGCGLLFGGIIMENWGGISSAYLVGAGLCFISSIYFTVFVAGHFNKNKLQ